MWKHINVCKNKNLFNSPMHTIVITTNTVGIMGAGLAKQAKHKYPDIYQPYQSACQSKIHTTNQPLLIKRSEKPQVLCFATKQHWKNKSRPEWIEQGLQWIINNQEEIKSIAIPPLGCGLGGLDYKTDLRPLYIKYLPQIQIPIELYL